MRNNRYLCGWAVAFFLMTVALALFSWIGSIYGIAEVQSLLSAEGVRWMLSHAISNYVQVPALGVVFVLMMGLGLVSRSGLSDVLKRAIRKDKKLSRKERRALGLSFIAGVSYVLVVLVAMLLPWNLLLSATGSWIHSPFSKGFVYLLSVGVGVSGMVYGYASDAFQRIGDVVEAMSSLISQHAIYFVVLFFTVQFFASLAYTRLPEWIGLSDEFFSNLTLICFYFPLLLLKSWEPEG